VFLDMIEHFLRQTFAQVFFRYRHPMHDHKVAIGYPFSPNIRILGLIIDQDGAIAHYFILVYKDKAYPFNNIIMNYGRIWITILPLGTSVLLSSLDASFKNVPNL